MKLFKFVCGDEERVGVFADEQAAHYGRTSIDPAYAYLPVEIVEVVIPGYTITIEPDQPESRHPPNFESMDKQQLREWLDDNNVQYVPQWGEPKLREAAIEAYEGVKHGTHS